MTKDEMLAVSHIVVNDYECGERTCRRMDMRGRFLIALISQDGEIRKKANGLMQRIMKFFILGLKTCRMTRIKERRKFAHYFCFHDIFPYFFGWVVPENLKIPMVIKNIGHSC